MKKLLVLAALILVSAAVVFAQELKFDGYLNSGVGFVADDNEDHDPYFKAFGVDSESNAFRFRLNGTFQNEAKNAGVRLRLQGQRRIDQSGYLSMPYLYGWLGFFENKLTLTGGLIMDGTWESADWWWNDDAGEGLGLLLKAEPIKGLTLGFGAYTISQQSGGSNNMLRVSNTTTTPAVTLPVKDSDGNDTGDTITIPSTTATTDRLPNFSELILKAEDVKYTIGAAYTMPDVFRLSAIFRTNNKAGWTATRDQNNYTYLGREESMFLQAELRVLAVKNLTAVVVGAFNRLEEFDKRGNMMFSETFGYKLDNLNVGLNAVQLVYNRPGADVDPGLVFNPWVSYTFDKIVPRLDLVYFLGGRSKTASGANQWERRGFVAQGGNLDDNGNPGLKDKDDDYSVFSIRPSVKINLDSRIFLEIGDMMNIDFANFDVPAYGNKKTLFTNVFYIDVKFSF
jgi:hypothetical protein